MGCLGYFQLKKGYGKSRPGFPVDGETTCYAAVEINDAIQRQFAQK
jgi:hypothetical protein